MATKPLPPDTGMVRRSSGDQAAVYIRRLIFDGNLRPGDRVPQDEVAQTLGISRIPIREALIALEAEGWLTIEMFRGAFINTIDAQFVRDQYELYGLLYGFAARRAFRRSNPDLLDRLAKIEHAISTTSDTVEMGRLSVEFQGAVIDGAHSPRIRLVLRAMSPLVPGDFFTEVPAAVALQKRATAAILRAGGRGDGDAAADEYLKVMRRIGEKVVEVFEARGLFDSADPAA